MTKWFYQKNAKAKAKKNPYYYKDKELVKTTKINTLSGERRRAWKWK